MRIGIVGFLGALLIGLQVSAQIPKLGSSDRLDVATWNIEWFGNGSNGPSNDEQQLQYASDILNTLDLDIMAVQEISNVAYWNRLLSNCSNYSGILSTWSQTQKTGLLFKKNQFEFLYQKHILANYDYDFGGGRLPLEVGLIPQHPSWPKGDTLRIWVLHMKANTGSSSSKVQAYNRRYNAGVALKMYVDKLGKSNKGLIMGDWNDDFDQSILSGYATPYQNYIKDTNYVVNSFPLSLTKQKSTVSYSDMIDHIVCTPGLKNQWIADSSMVLYADKWISNYGNVVSDHYPVFTKFKWLGSDNNISCIDIKYSELKLKLENGGLIFSCENSKITEFEELRIYDLSMKEVIRTKSRFFESPVEDKWYVYELLSGNGASLHAGFFSVSQDGHILYR